MAIKTVVIASYVHNEVITCSNNNSTGGEGIELLQLDDIKLLILEDIDDINIVRRFLGKEPMEIDEGDKVLFTYLERPRFDGTQKITFIDLIDEFDKYRIVNPLREDGRSYHIKIFITNAEEESSLHFYTDFLLYEGFEEVKKKFPNEFYLYKPIIEVNKSDEGYGDYEDVDECIDLISLVTNPDLEHMSLSIHIYRS